MRLAALARLSPCQPSQRSVKHGGRTLRATRAFVVTGVDELGRAAVRVVARGGVIRGALRAAAGGRAVRGGCAKGTTGSGGRWEKRPAAQRRDGGEPACGVAARATTTPPARRLSARRRRDVLVFSPAVRVSALSQLPRAVRELRGRKGRAHRRLLHRVAPGERDGGLRRLGGGSGCCWRRPAHTKSREFSFRRRRRQAAPSGAVGAGRRRGHEHLATRSARQRRKFTLGEKTHFSELPALSRFRKPVAHGDE